MVYSIKRTIQFDEEGNRVLSSLRNNIDEIRTAVLEMMENSNRLEPSEVRAKIEKVYKSFKEIKDPMEQLKKIGDELPE